MQPVIEQIQLPVGYKLTPDDSGFSGSELVAVAVSSVMAIVAVVLIFLPVFHADGKEHQNLQSAGLGLLTAAATAARQGVKG